MKGRAISQMRSTVLAKAQVRRSSSSEVGWSSRKRSQIEGRSVRGVADDPIAAYGLGSCLFPLVSVIREGARNSSEPGWTTFPEKKSEL